MMTYLGYYIQVRNCPWQGGGAEADITAKDGEHISITDTDRFSVEESAREIVDYATCRGIALDAASQQVLH
jgi:hypothetical protein